MRLTFKKEPFPHALISDFFTEGEMKTVLDEKRRLDYALQPPEATGSAVHEGTGRPLKFNDGIFLSSAMPNSEIVALASKHTFHEVVNQVPCDWWNSLWKQSNLRSWLLSRYRDGQYYNAHVDKSLFTMLVWFYEEPKTFTGGDLIFPDYNIKIPCVNNTGIIFFGPTRHEVPPVKGHGRYTLTMFTGIHGNLDK